MSLPAIAPKQLQTSEWYHQAMEQLVGVVQDLSHARDMDAVAAIVRKAARELTGADGASFVLRDGDNCHYVDENAISPLWKGKKFPMSMCVSGWVMMNAQSVTIEDIYQDKRVPTEAYRPTFVKSMAMVPIRRQSPIGAIGNYWARTRQPTDEEVVILQALADTTSVAIENVELYRQLNNKMHALQQSNDELSHFAWVASHDLQEPLRTIAIQMDVLKKRYGGELDEKAIKHLDTAIGGAERLKNLVRDILVHARAKEIKEYKPIDTNELLNEAKETLLQQIAETETTIESADLPVIYGEKDMMFRVFLNLISNAIKFHRKGVLPIIKISAEQKKAHWEFKFEDNGIGIEEQYLDKVFGLFMRLHSRDDYNGSGIGLSTCKKIIEMHGGEIWAENREHGCAIHFTIPTVINQLMSKNHESVIG